MTLRLFCEEFCHIKFLNMFKYFRDYFAPLGDTCEEIRNHWGLFQDCFATRSRCLSPAVAKQSQSSEIGALEFFSTFNGRFNFKGLFNEAHYIKVLFKPVRTQQQLRSYAEAATA